MLSGAVTVELAEVSIDDDVGMVRRLKPGPYVLIAMNFDGPGAQQGVPQDLFETADPGPWSEMREEVQAARAAVLGVNGQVWLAREGSSAMVLEFYLPRVAETGAR